MGARQKFQSNKFMDAWSTLEPFSQYSKEPASSEKRKAFKVVLTKITMDHVQRHGATGTKRKRALKRFRAYIEDETVNPIAAVQEATRLGVPYETITTVATLLS